MYSCVAENGLLHLVFQEFLKNIVTIFHKVANFCDFLFAALHSKPLLKKVYTKGANSFLLE